MNELIGILISLGIGFVAGIATGMFGIGGGIIYVPTLFFTLSLFLAENTYLPYIVIATSLFAGSFGATGAFVNHYKAENVNIRMSFLLAAGSIISAVTIPQIVVQLNPKIFKIILCSILILVAIRMFLENESLQKKLTINKYFLIPLGILVGLVSTVTGLGGGVLFVPILIYLYSFEIKAAVGTSTLVVALTMIFSAATYGLMEIDNNHSLFQIGYINLIAGLPLGIGALLGSKYGVKLVFRFKSLIIKRLFAALLVVLLIKILFSF